ncbi:hypothetical protein FXF51_05890 [Nonomuraea sp. PA05]|uniref:hypothetical protein n=1 Tax=Nonomuraea sp. PA05 TaxID=2604466 RepID=UPI0011D40674|nr:hypothetical protein [Nonomuraea sp. PA05]TYB69691.1 hypothetical protein FXF51_05890 [Nonomuraea sp. PA05]
MARYRKTIEVEAVQWTGDNRDEVLALVGSFRSRTTFTSHEPSLVQIWMTEWHRMEVPVGDWIAEEPMGDTMALRHVWVSEFAAGYQPVQDIEAAQ